MDILHRIITALLLRMGPTDAKDEARWHKSRRSAAAAHFGDSRRVRR